MRLRGCGFGVVILILAGVRNGCGLSLDLHSPESIKSTAHTLATDMLAYYTGHLPGETPGLLPYPYYWWEAGAMFGSLIDYYGYTSDASFNTLVTNGMLFQVGPNADFMPPNQTKTLGNDDQCFWALSAMSAAENNFPDPPHGQPQWLALAQAVFNTQVLRWNTRTCGGGLKWQIYTFNAGYNYKNTISNGCFFNLGARLALYTRNETYAEWAEKSWDWMLGAGLVSASWEVFDGSGDDDNCTTINGAQWSYNAGILLAGAATMFNYTNGSPEWRGRADNLLTHIASKFFQSSIMYEETCEGSDNCNVDQLSFKAYLSRWLASTTKMAPFTYDRVMALLQPSAAAAALQCNGGENGRTCGLKWTQRKNWDGTNGVGQQMAALEVVQSTLLSSESKPLVTGDKGGTSTGDPGAGSNPKNNKKLLLGAAGREPTNADRVGAAVLTAFVLLGVLIATVWVNDGYEMARYLVAKFDASSLGAKLDGYFIPRG